MGRNKRMTPRFLKFRYLGFRVWKRKGRKRKEKEGKEKERKEMICAYYTAVYPQRKPLPLSDDRCKKR